jgi:aspartyl-tRNA(Asn)/glutamyl-tRNA(Gln) amidotransferase subunit A
VGRAVSVTDLTISEASALLQARKVSPVELTNAFLERIASVDGDVKAFVTLVPERALSDAKRAEEELSNGVARGPLHGVPIALKDIVETAGIPTQAGSRVLEDWVPPTSATVARKLEEAGTVLLGKVTTHEFAMDVFTPPTCNPWDLDRIPGGSSGGSAAAIASRTCLGTIGTDTAGSIRVPAALCGVSGLKPTYGRVSRAGVIPFSWSLDHVGPIARTARDLALILEAVAGIDPRDPSSSAEPVPRYVEQIDEGMDAPRIGIPDDFFFERVSEDAATTALGAVEELGSLGAQQTRVSVPTVRMATVVGDAVSFPEVSVYHRRWLRERPDDYTPATRVNLELGELFLATDYVQAQRVRTVITRDFLDAFAHVDAIAAPATAVPAIRREEDVVSFGPEDEENPLYAYCRLTYPANVAGLPALSIPCGFSSDGLPLGLQLIGRPFEEGRLLQIADAFQRVTDWHSRPPSGLDRTHASSDLGSQ